MESISLLELALANQGELKGDNIAIRSICTDTRALKPGDVFFALKGPNFDAHDFLEEAHKKGAAALVVNRFFEHLNLPQVVVYDPLLALGELARLKRTEITVPVIAVTGSCGKTSVKTMIASILAEVGPSLATEGNYNNEIGLPLQIFQYTPHQKNVVLEMGASKLGDLNYLSLIVKPTIAVITMAGAAHLKGFRSLEGVARAKAQIFDGLKEGGIAVINADDSFCEFWKEYASSYRIMTFGFQEKADVFATDIVMHGLAGSSFTLHLPDGNKAAIGLQFPGEHMVRNALAASACCFAAGISLAAIEKGLFKATPVQGRLVKHHLKNNATLIDDSYNANPHSVKAALEVLAKCPGETIFVMGDMLELGDDEIALHQEIGLEAKRLGISHLLAKGALSSHAVAAFGEGGKSFDSHEDLTNYLWNHLPHNSHVLIKGSNSSGMGKVVSGLLHCHEQQETVG